MTKILVIGQVPPPDHGANFMTEVMLNVLQGKNYNVTFINKFFSKTPQDIGKVSIRKLIRMPILMAKMLIKCLHIRPEICIYFIALGKIGFLADNFILFLLSMCRIPYILDIHGKGFYNLCTSNNIWRILVRTALSNALGGMVRGEILKNDVNMFIPNDRLMVVPNAIPNLPLVNQTNHRDNIKVLFLSHLKPLKGPLEFLKAAKIANQKRQDIRFVLAGPDRDKSFSQKLKTYVKDNGLNEYVEMPGGIYGEDKEKLFASSDIFVFPTHWETFGLVIIEAMRAGLPVISSSEGAIPEIIQDGLTGFIINPNCPEEIADRILVLADNPNLRRSMGMKGREVFESKYTLEVYAEKLDKAIKVFLDMIKHTK